MKRRLQYDLTKGPVVNGILGFAVPLMISNLIQTTYNAVDMYFVGAYAGTAGVSAVSVCGPVMNVMIVTLSGMSAGVTVVIGSLAGRKGSAEIADAANTAFTLYFLMAAVVTAAGFLFAPQVLMLVQTPREAYDHALIYLRVMFLGIVFLFGYNLIGALQRGLGDSLSSLRYVVTAAVVNIALDYLLVGRLSMRTGGAAAATVAAQMVSFFMGLWEFQTGGHVIRLRIRNMGFSRRHLKSILWFGIPTAFNEVMVNAAMLTVSGVANSFGLAQSAAYGIGSRINSFAIFSDGAMNQTMSSFASQNIGAGEEKRAMQGLKECLKISAAIAAVTSVIVFAAAPQLSRLFDRDPEVVNWTVRFLHVTVWSYVLFALVGPLIGFIRGTGNVTASVAVGFVAQCVFRIPFSFLFGHLYGFPGVGAAVLIGPLSSVVMYSFWVLSGRWRRGIVSVERM